MVKFDTAISEEERLTKLEEIKKKKEGELKKLEEQKKKEIEEAEHLIEEALGDIENTKELEEEEETEKEAAKKKMKKEETLEETVEKEKVTEQEVRQTEYKMKPLDILYQVASENTVDRLRELTYQSRPWSEQDVEDYRKIKENINAVVQTMEEKYVKTVGEETMDKFYEARKVLRELGYKR